MISFTLGLDTIQDHIVRNYDLVEFVALGLMNFTSVSFVWCQPLSMIWSGPGCPGRPLTCHLLQPGWEDTEGLQGQMENGIPPVSPVGLPRGLLHA